MVFPVAHKVLTISGPLFGGADRWTCRLRLYDSAAPDAPTQAECDAFEAPLRTWFTSASTNFSTVHSLDLIKLNRVGVDGKVPAADVVRMKVPSPAINGSYSTNPSWPGQCSMVMGLSTVKPRGLAHLGRIYPPPSGVDISSDGRITAAIAAQWAGTLRTLLNSINALGAPKVAIFSKVGAGDWQYVTGVRVGRVVDTQRRRRSSLAEEYQVIAL